MEWVVALLLLGVVAWVVFAKRTGESRSEQRVRQTERSVSQLVQYSTEARPAQMRRVARSTGGPDFNAMALERHLQLVSESLAIIRATKNEATLQSRVGVARDSVRDASVGVGWSLTAHQVDQLLGEIDIAASQSTVRIRLAKAEGLIKKAADAKTAATRGKRQAEATALLRAALVDRAVLPQHRGPLDAALKSLETASGPRPEE